LSIVKYDRDSHHCYNVNMKLNNRKAAYQLDYYLFKEKIIIFKKKNISYFIFCCAVVVIIYSTALDYKNNTKYLGVEVFFREFILFRVYREYVKHYSALIW